MSIPTDPPSDPQQPHDQPQPPSSNNKRKGAITATATILGVSALFAAGGLGVFALGIGSLVALVCVILGSLLTISRESRSFAIGFLVASAILLVVTAGVCLGALNALGL